MTLRELREHRRLTLVEMCYWHGFTLRRGWRGWIEAAVVAARMRRCEMCDGPGRSCDWCNGFGHYDPRDA